MTGPRSEIDLLDVARAHGTLIAATWGGVSRSRVVALRRAVDGYSRGRGHPSRAEMDAMALRRGCECPRCREHFARAEELDRRRRLAGLRDEDPRDWRTRALCVGLDPAVFFPGRGESHAEARAVCDACPVDDDCLDFAIASGEKFGIWGGISERERRRLRRAARTRGA